MQNIADNFVTHTIEPVYDKNSKILILGTMPSPKSREIGFYYSHPQNRFWRVMAGVFSQNIPTTVEERKNFALVNEFALWDVLKSCKIKKADDSSISEPIVNDISKIFAIADIKAVFTTGKKATSLYEKYCPKFLHPIYLPSTSPANCTLSLEQLIQEYNVILKWM